MGAISIASRAEIFSQFLAGKTSSADKRVYAMCGIPGSGKSTYVGRALQAGHFPKNAFVLNPDNVMHALPEYRKTFDRDGAETAFCAWELPARKLAYDLLRHAADRGLNIIIDMGCVRDEDSNNILDLKKRGYQVHIYHIFCPPEIALQRIGGRERFTPEDMIRQRYEALKTMVSKYHLMAHQFFMFDNSDQDQPFRKVDINSLPDVISFN